MVSSFGSSFLAAGLASSFLASVLAGALDEAYPDPEPDPPNETVANFFWPEAITSWSGFPDNFLIVSSRAASSKWAPTSDKIFFISSFVGLSFPPNYAKQYAAKYLRPIWLLKLWFFSLILYSSQILSCLLFSLIRRKGQSKQGWCQEDLNWSRNQCWR